MVYKFGPFRLDSRQRELQRNGEPAPLTPRAFDILALFLQNPGKLIAREQLLETIWPDSNVEDSNVSQNIFLVRRALGTDENGSSYIQTIPRRGYRFTAQVTQEESPSPENINSIPLESDVTAGYWSQHSPFRGLRAFEPKDSWLFFGRDSETSELCDRLTHSRMVAVVGNSGSGKSSLVRAGLIPALRLMHSRPIEPPMAPWRIALFRPSNSPLDYLAEVLPGALAPELSAEDQAMFTARFRNTLPGGGSALHDAIHELRDAVSGDALRSHFLLVADQFEEIFTLTADPALRSRYIDALLSVTTSEDPQVHLVLVLRADFYGQCLEHAGLSYCLERSVFNIPPMTAGRMRETIEKRLALARARAEAGLIESLLADVGTEPGNLALLEHALGQLWKLSGGHGGLLTTRAYEEIGRVSGAVSKHADEVYESLGDDDQKHLAQRIFLELVQLGDGAQDTSRRVRKNDLLSLGPPGLVELLLAQLVTSRLISAGGEGQQTFIEVSHEALIRNWSALRQWLAQNREELELERRLHQATEEWQTLQYDPGALLRGARLAQAEEWRTRRKEVSPDLERFLQASAEAHEDAERMKEEAQEREIVTQQELRHQAEARVVAERQLREQQEAASLEQGKAAARLRLFSWGLAILSILLLAASAALWSTYRQALIGQSRSLAAEALAVKERDHGRARALAIQNWRTTETPQARLAVAETFPEQLAVLKVRQDDKDKNGDKKDPIVGAVFSPDGRRVLTASYDHTAYLWSTADGRLLATLTGHTEKVEHATFSPDGRQIATASWDHTARLWNASDGKLLVTLKGHEDAVFHVAFSPDGHRVVTASSDHTARLWNGASGQEIAVLNHDDVVTGAEFSPDGRLIVTSSWDHTARLWDASAGRLLITLRGHTGELRCAGFSLDGRRVITTSSDDTARVWDSRDGRMLNTLHHESRVITARFSPDGLYIVTASGDNTARVWSSINGSLLVTLHHDGEVQYAEFSPDGRHIVTASSDYLARLWNTADGRLLAIFKGHTDRVTHAAIAPDNQHVVTASADGSARLWNTVAGSVQATLLGHNDLLSRAAFSPDGARIVTASFDKTARVWSSTDGRLLATLSGHTAEIFHVTFSPDGQRIVTTGADTTARIWNSNDGKQLAILKGHTGPVHFAAFSADGRRIVTASADKTARLWSPSDGRLLATLPGHTAEVWRAMFSPDGRRIVTASADKTARVWSSNGNLITTLQGHAAGVVDAEFSPDGQQIVTASQDHTARVWSSADGRLIATLQGHSGTIWYAKFSPDGRRIVTASDDKTAKIWNSHDGRLLVSLEGHTAELRYAEFSPDGKAVLTAGLDDTARVWNSADGALQTRLEGHTSAVRQASFSPDGQRIVTISLDHTARVWKLLTLSDIEKLLVK